MAGPARANRELVVYGLYMAGGAAERVHTEDVALKCWQLFPDSFSWTKFPQYPDKDIVRVALTDARKDKYGALVSGRVEGHAPGSAQVEQDGWTLTETGIAWANANAHLFAGAGAQHERKSHRQLVLRRVKELKSNNLFRQFEESGASFAPAIGELAAFLRCRVDANQSVWERRLSEIRRLGVDAADDVIGQFVVACSDAYHRQR